MLQSDPGSIITCFHTLNFSSEVTKTKTKITKAKKGKNSKQHMWTENLMAGIDQTLYVLLSDNA